MKQLQFQQTDGMRGKVELAFQMGQRLADEEIHGKLGE